MGSKDFDIGDIDKIVDLILEKHIDLITAIGLLLGTIVVLVFPILQSIDPQWAPAVLVGGATVAFGRWIKKYRNAKKMIASQPPQSAETFTPPPPPPKDPTE